MAEYAGGCAMTATHLQIAVRAWATTNQPRRRASQNTSPKWPDTVLLLDCETTTDETQRLTFGFYRLCAWTDTYDLTCAEEGIFSGDDLAHLDAPGLAVLRQYAATHQQDTHGAPPKPLTVRTRREFVEGVFYSEAYSTRSMVVGFNLPFDLSRLAVRWGNARGRNAGGISLTLFERWDAVAGKYIENKYRPRLVIVSLDSKRALIRFTRTGKIDPDDMIPEGSADNVPVIGYRFRGRFLDLKTLIFALTDKAHSLRSACKSLNAATLKGDAGAHGVITPQYIDYARQDVAATQALLVAARREFDRHDDIDLLPDQAYSPAALPKAYLRAMGITPLLERDP
jgi:hypothetical protein